MTKEEMKNYAIETIENMEELRDDLARINLSSKLDILNENLRATCKFKPLQTANFFS